MTHRSRDLAFIAASAFVLLGGLVWLSLPTGNDASESLDESRSLARARRFEEAQSRVDRYLRSHPEDVQAHLLIAEIATDRPDPMPELALDHLRRIRTKPKQEALGALVKFVEGKAEYQSGMYVEAEASWDEALRLDPTVPEAGSALLDLMEREGRLEEAYAFGRHLFEIEPNPRDRVRLLIELSRLDLDRPDPESVVLFLEPLVRKAPQNLPLAASLGLALIHNSRLGQGVEVLREMLGRHPASADAWQAWLTGLDDAARPEELAREYALLPKPLAADPRFARFEGVAAQAKNDWPSAAEAYGRAHAREPHNANILYRLSRVQRLLGTTEERTRIERLLKAYQDSYIELRGVINGALKLTDLGVRPHPDLYNRLAELRERMGRLDEARAWHHLLLLETPGHAPSLAALLRLESTGTSRP